MWQSVRSLVFQPRTLLIVYIVGAVFYAIQLISFGYHPFIMPKAGTIPADIMNQPKYLELYIGKYFTEYNNYVIFKSSWFHLLHGDNLYSLYPNEHWDFYKYSPTFSLFMGLLAYLPDYIGLLVWNILNGVTLYFAVRMLPVNTRTQCIVLWFIFNELITSYSNTQSNGIVCALFLASFVCLQNSKMIWATLWLMIAVYIKVYGAVGFCMFLFYPGKLKGLLYAALWGILLAALPLVVIPLHTLLWQYQNWYLLMKADVSTALGMSVTGWLHSWFGLSRGYEYITVTGILLFLLPFARIKMYQDAMFRLLIFASMLIWVIIFNRKAESPTYIIAITGVAIWYFIRPRATWRTVLLGAVFVFTSLSTTDFFPQFIFEAYIKPYTIKAVPCIIAWCVIWVELMLLKPGVPIAKSARPEVIAAG